MYILGVLLIGRLATNAYASAAPPVSGGHPRSGVQNGQLDIGVGISPHKCFFFRCFVR